MKRTSAILFSIFLTFVLLTSCKEVKEADIYGQRSKIESYITKELIEKGGYVFDNYLAEQTGVYRVFMEQYDLRPQIEIGDSVEFWFIGEVFDGAPKGVFYTNVPAVLLSLTNGNLSPNYWESTPYKAKLGSTPLHKGLEVGLRNCHEQDSLMLILTSNLAFGNAQMPTVPENSIVSYKIRISKVTKP